MIASRPIRVVLSVVAVVTMAGCASMTPGRSRDLGQVNYQDAYGTAREIFRDHFPIATEDPVTGVIVSQPVAAEATPERLLGGGSDARKVATLRIRRENGRVVAQLAVAIERRGGEIYHRSVIDRENYDSVPDETPAQRDAAVTPEQSDVWEVRGYDHTAERQILAEIHRALTSGTQPQ